MARIPISTPISAPSHTRPRVRPFDGWNRRDWSQLGGLLALIGLMHVVGFGALVLVVAPAHYSVGTQVFGIGLGITAYTYGLRHAFDADHIAAIDNTTRKLMADGQRPKSVGFWFALGHSAMVFVLAGLVSAGASLVRALLANDSATHRTLGMLGTLASGGFLYLIGLLNLVALVGIWRVFRAMRKGVYDEAELERRLASRGVVGRVFAKAGKAIRTPWQMFPLGMLFGLGFDTATEVALLVLAGSGAAAGLPWYAVLVLPLLFVAGMSLLDCLDGVFMTVAYDWAFASPIRKVYYNLAVTGLSVAVALVIGTVELVGVLGKKIGLNNPVTNRIVDIDLGNVGFLIVGLFVAVWAIALLFWKFGRVEERWHARLAQSAPES